MFDDFTAPSSGVITLNVNSAPVSLQGRAERKEALKADIRKEIEDAKFYLTGDLKIKIDWFISEEKRYESSDYADVDNIIKPILDGLCGHGNLLIDDNQVQSITCNWIDTSEEGERLVIEIEYRPDESYVKDGLFFVNVKDNLCLPLNSNISKDTNLQIVDVYKKAFDIREAMSQAGLDYYQAKAIMPTQRVFHKGRVLEFNILTEQELANS